jgi:hypothetical protein
MISFNDFQCYLTHYTKNESRKRFMQNTIEKNCRILMFINNLK